MFINKFSGPPPYEQIISQMRREILNGIREPLSKVPSVRELSQELGVNPNTVQRAYTEMTQAGLLSVAVGNGVYVSERAKEVLLNEAQKDLESIKTRLCDLKNAGITEQQMIETVHAVYQA